MNVIQSCSEVGADWGWHALVWCFGGSALRNCGEVPAPAGWSSVTVTVLSPVYYRRLTLSLVTWEKTGILSCIQRAKLLWASGCSATWCQPVLPIHDPNRLWHRGPLKCRCFYILFYIVSLIPYYNARGWNIVEGWKCVKFRSRIRRWLVRDRVESRKLRIVVCNWLMRAGQEEIVSR